jgi:hypothetical protein
MNQVQAELQRFKKDTAYYEAHHDELLEKWVFRLFGDRRGGEHTGRQGLLSPATQ